MCRSSILPGGGQVACRTRIAIGLWAWGRYLGGFGVLPGRLRQATILRRRAYTDDVSFSASWPEQSISGVEE